MSLLPPITGITWIMQEKIGGFTDFLFKKKNGTTNQNTCISGEWRQFQAIENINSIENRIEIYE